MQRILSTLLLTCLCVSDAQTTGMTGQEKAIQDRMGLRKLPDGERARVTKDLALEIRELPASVNKLNLASRSYRPRSTNSTSHPALRISRLKATSVATRFKKSPRH
jgi:hypothetical protein